MKFIIEHLEPRLYQWCIIEYKHISEMVGKSNVIFTNIKAKDKSKLSKLGKVYTKSAKDLKLKRACVLDPYSDIELKPNDKKKFNYFIFGGILGNEPAEGRTRKLTAQLNFPARNLGKKQLATDTAVLVTKLILLGKPLDKIEFTDNVEIKTNENESIILPYPYAVIDNKAIISAELVDYLKRRKGF